MTVRLILFTVKLVIIIGLVENKLILKQVVILNRHSLRSPLSANLKDLTPKVWPKWDANPGYLTEKGAKLAGYMGSYFAAWLKNETLLPSCPDEDELQVYSNTKDRTLKSAQSFLENGFPDCSINIRHPGVDIPNPLFNPVIHNSSTSFRDQALNEIHQVLDALQIDEAYELVSNILDYKQSRSCEIDNKCSLAKGKNYVNITLGYRPKLFGPLKASNEVVDAFLMQNYEGFPTEHIAWGQLNDLNLWQTVIELNRAYFNVTYKTPLIASDVSGPLIRCISEKFLKEDNRPKATIFFGHDVNIYTVLKTLSVKPYNLENQIEIIPIGSAVVFQKWEDEELNKDYFKLSLVYQSTGQIRDSNILSLESPPYIRTLELEKCKIDVNGFCQWHDFESLLRTL